MSAPTPSHAKQALWLGVLGVVFGDIGTSPLYALRESFRASGNAVTEPALLGILSLITWALLLIVTLKYITILLRVDNRGEGGIMALTARAGMLVSNPRTRAVALTIGLFGTALFYADSLITPAISVLGAVEGLSVVAPGLAGLVLPLAVVLLIGLFAVQRFGTGQVGSWFGPVMLVWFSTLAMLGLNGILMNPGVLAAFNPLHALHFVSASPTLALLTMGAIILAVTGAEALYADLGHFGRQPIQRMWLILVGPALLLNYYGQGALLLSDPTTLTNPFYLLAPEGLRVSLLLLATAATIIASQAVISGAFSLTQQAIRLGVLPRLNIMHTSPNQAGQIYLPTLTALMAVAVILLVLVFGSSSNLAGAYGLAVSGAMLADTLLLVIVLGALGGKKLWLLLPLLLVFMVLESAFLGATLLKLLQGAWFPLLLGGLLFYLMHTWRVGRSRTRALTFQQTPPLEYFLTHLDPNLPTVPRTAVFLTSDLTHAPPALLYNLHHNGVWHEQTLLVKIERAPTPRYPASERIRVTHHSHGLSTVSAIYGFLEEPHVPRLLAKLPDHGLPLRHPESLSYFLSTHTYVSSPKPILRRWQEPLFILLDTLQQSAVSYFHLPRGKVIELANQIEI